MELGIRFQETRKSNCHTHQIYLIRTTVSSLIKFYVQA